MESVGLFSGSIQGSTPSDSTSGALAAASAMLAQKTKAERDATLARMAADAQTKKVLATALQKIEELTIRVNTQDARIVALERDRKRVLAALNVTVADLARRVDALEGGVRQIQKHIELLKYSARHHFITTSGDLRWTGQPFLSDLVDQHLQMRRPVGVQAGETELEKFLQINSSEDHLWRVGRVPRSRR